jgi:hypothetical protein
MLDRLLRPTACPMQSPGPKRRARVVSALTVRFGATVVGAAVSYVRGVVAAVEDVLRGPA